MAIYSLSMVEIKVSSINIYIHMEIERDIKNKYGIREEYRVKETGLFLQLVTFPVYWKGNRPKV
jgi:hypothetical protein